MQQNVALTGGGVDRCQWPLSLHGPWGQLLAPIEGAHSFSASGCMHGLMLR